MSNVEVLPDAVRNELRFQLEKRLVKDEDAFEQDVQRLITKIDDLAKFDGKINTSPHSCLEFLKKSEELSIITDKLGIYRTLQESIDTKKTGVASSFYSRVTPHYAKLVFSELELQSISEDTWKQWCKEVPELSHYTEMMRQTWRTIPHTLSRKEEELLARISPLTSQWQKDLYQQLINRADFEEFDVDGKKLHAMRDFSVLMLHKDRSLREKSWRAYFKGYASQKDLFAFSLYRVAVTGNTKAQISKFEDSLGRQAFRFDLTKSQIDNLWAGVEQMTPYLKRYHAADVDRRRKQLKFSEVEPWDMEQEADTFEQPIYPAITAFDHINHALQLLGNDVSRELKDLLTPENGRVDMFGGPYRRPGAFSINSGTFPGFFYLDQYHGTLNQMRTIAHEAGHTVHHTLMAQQGLPPYTVNGPSYVTETAAMTFEEILHNHLLDIESNEKIRDYLWQKQLSDLMSAPRIGWIAYFEASMYKTVQEREVTGKGPMNPEDWNELAKPAVSALSYFYPKYQEPLALWQRVHHYYTVPLYNLNYLISKLLTQEIMGRIEQDKSFSKNATKLFSHPFDRPPTKVILNSVGIDFNRDDWFMEAVKRMEQQVKLFEMYVAKL